MARRKGLKAGGTAEEIGPDWPAYFTKYGINRALPLAVCVSQVLQYTAILNANVVVESILYLVFLLAMATLL